VAKRNRKNKWPNDTHLRRSLLKHDGGRCAVNAWFARAASLKYRGRRTKEGDAAPLGVGTAPLVPAFLGPDPRTDRNPWRGDVGCLRRPVNDSAEVPMSTHHECRQKGEECREKAKAATDPRDRAIWLRIAALWMKMAQANDEHRETFGTRALMAREPSPSPSALQARDLQQT
jgi:hypothetical protein